jgi:hypothetical protein
MLHSLTLLAAILAPMGQTPATLHVCVWEPMDRAAEQAMQLIISRYRTHRPGVSVAMMRYPIEDGHGLLRRWCKGEKTWRPDVVVVPDVWLPDIANELEPPAAGTIARVRSIAPPGLIDRVTVAQQMRAIPYWLEPRLLFYWPDLLGERNWQPGSWDQVLDAAAKARRKSRSWGLGIPGRGAGVAMMFSEIVWALGGDLLDGTGQIDLMNAKAEDALDLLIRAEREGIAEPQMLTWSQGDLEDLFADRKLAVLVAAAGLEQSLTAAERAKCGVAPLPGRPVFTSMAVDGLAVFKDNARAAEAQDFVALAASADGQACIAEAGGLPADSELARRTVRSAALKAALLGVKNLRGLPREKADALVGAVERATWLAVSGRMLSPRALEEGQAMLPTKLAE